MDANVKDLLKDRSWMNYNSASDRRKPDYENGVTAFLDFAFSNAGSSAKIRCPCVNCYLVSSHERRVVFYHLLARGILKDYNPWTQHGEDEIEDENITCETPKAIAHEEDLPSPRVEKNVNSSRLGKRNNGENNVRSSRQEKHTGGDNRRVVKENRAIHLESDEDRSSPIIPPNVWNYVNAIGMSKTDAGGDVHHANDEDDDNGDPDASVGEDNNFAALDNYDSSSCDDADFAPFEAEQVAADGYSSEAAQAKSSDNGKISKGRRRKPRGLKWKKELENTTEQVKVELPAKVGRVVGKNARQFVVEASWLLKNTLPPNVIKWKDLDPKDVAKLLDKVKNRFIFPNESHVDKALLWQFKQWYRAWRSDMRRSYFCKYDTYEEKLSHRPPYLKREQWKWLVDYWSSEKFKNISASNSKVRRNTKGFACLGPTSIARLAYELETNQANQDSDHTPTYLILYEKQRRKLNKTWITKEAEEGYNKLVKLHQEQVEEHGSDNLSPSEAYAKTFTQDQCKILLGLGENPIALKGSGFKRRRTGCSDQRIIDASVSATRLELEPAQKSDDDEEEEEKTGKDTLIDKCMSRTEIEPALKSDDGKEEEEERTGDGHSDRQLHSKVRELIRKIRQDTGGGVHQGEDYDDDVDRDPDVSIGEDNNFAAVDNCDSSPIQSGDDANIVATEAEQVAADPGTAKRRRGRPRGSKSKKKILEKSTERVKVELPAKVGRVVGPNARRFVHEETNQSNQDSDHTPIYLILYEKKNRKIDKTWITKEAEEGYNKLVKLHQEQVEEHGLDNLSPYEAYAKTFTRAQCKILLGLGENHTALEGSSFKRRRTGCSDERIIELEPAEKSDDEEEETADKCVLNCASKFETEPAQKSDDEEEERTGGGHCDRQLRSKMREQIRKIRQGLASSSTKKA